MRNLVSILAACAIVVSSCASGNVVRREGQETVKFSSVYFNEFGRGLYFDTPNIVNASVDTSHINHVLKSENGKVYGLVSGDNVLYGIFVTGAKFSDSDPSPRELAESIMGVLGFGSFTTKRVHRKKTDFYRFLEDY